MVTRRDLLPGTFFLSILLVLYASTANAAPKGKSITYLPNDEAMDTLSKTYTATNEKILSEIVCAQTDAFQLASDCLYCVRNLKVRCKDCCLNFSPNRSVKCADKACSLPAPFDYKNCSSLNCPAQDSANPCCTYAYDCTQPDTEERNPCQEQACTTMPEGGHCVRENPADPANANWICTEQLPMSTPPAKSCPSASVADCSKLETKFFYKKPTPGPCPAALDPNSEGLTCSTYVPETELYKCYMNCIAYTTQQNTCAKSESCCKKNVCTGVSPTGYDSNCDTTACQERVNAPTCDALAADSCTEYMHSAVDCLRNNCNSCFKEVDESFSYRFVAKSNESYQIFWQLVVDNIAVGTYLDNIPAYLFTMVKVTDAYTGKEVHHSLLHQKYLQSSFSIFSATPVGKDVLQQGNTYIVKLYYFIPSIKGVDLKVKVNSAQLIVVRVRE